MLVKVRDERVGNALAVAFVLLQFYKPYTRMKSLYNLHVALFETVLKKTVGIKSGMKLMENTSPTLKSLDIIENTI